MALGTKGNTEAKFTLILRSLIMLDDSLSQVMEDLIHMLHMLTTQHRARH